MNAFIYRSFGLIALITLLAGCNAFQNRAEFGAPQSRWPANLPSRVAADAPPPPIPAQYCYRTLASVDCYTEAKPDRLTGYTGVYPNPETIAVEAPYAAAPREPLIPNFLPQIMQILPSAKTDLSDSR
jgi:hypothetical protein